MMFILPVSRSMLRLTGVVAVSLLLVLPQNATATGVVTFADGTRLSVQGYELKGELVVMTTLDGKLQSVPRSYVDLEATERMNGRGAASIRATTGSRRTAARHAARR